MHSYFTTVLVLLVTITAKNTSKLMATNTWQIDCWPQYDLYVVGQHGILCKKGNQ